MQARNFGPNLPPEQKTDLSKARKETSVLWYVRRFHPNNAGNRSGPRARAYVEITHAQGGLGACSPSCHEKQKASGSTGFNNSGMHWELSDG